MKLESPYMRYELMFSLKELGDRDLHKKWFGLRYNLIFGEDIKKGLKEASNYDKWVTSDSPTAFWSNFRMNLDCIFDSINFQAVVDGEALFDFQVGYVLFDREEAEFVMKTVLALEKICQTVGLKQPGAAYLGSPLWDDIVSSSKKSYDLLASNNKKYGLDFKELWGKAD